MLLTIILFIAVLAVLVLIHELGHFIAARAAGLTVEEFGFGFPPRIASIKRGETRYSLNLLPLGGFVKILGEDGHDHSNPKSFASKPAWVRVVILLAGVIMNFLLGVVLFAIVYSIGAPTTITDDLKNVQIRDAHIQIVTVVPNTPADEAGLDGFDTVKAVNGQAITTVEEVQQSVTAANGQPLLLTLSGPEGTKDVTITPRTNPPAGEGPLGVELARVGIVRFPWYSALWQALVTSVSLLFLIVRELGRIFGDFFTTGHVDGNAFSGPVGIAVFTGQVARMGVNYFLQFIAFLSLQLAFLNAVPFPALDGGRVLFVLIGKLRGKALQARVEGLIHLIGFALLLALIIAVSFHDVYRFREQFLGLWQRFLSIF